MIRVEGYSLWLMPEGEVYKRLNTLISRLSEEYSAPDFSPHVTLIGQVIGPEEEIISRTSELASFIEPYEIKLTGTGFLDEYFRCLFVRVEETAEVMGANSRAREVFGRYADPPYMPHLSLMYGDFPPETKREIISGIDDDFNISFSVESIHLFSTSGGPGNWRRVKAFALK